jgi:hypothetical protein
MYKIYKIVDNTNGNIYIGQTKSEVRVRIYKHKYEYKIKRNICSSKDILCNNDWCYELIEDNLNKEEANIKEIYYINNTLNCINTIKYTGENIEKRNKTMKEYKLKNEKKINDYQKNYYHLKNSWGGDPRSNNNLLKIDVNLFN